MPNRLISESSPYLLQHANNPVDWRPWGEEALAKARTENKPIFLSIGYAACHWCHVMARESFEDEETAALMNENFINIKVDREERPDLDAIYMQATVAMTGSGGWPMSVFLAPDLKPFFAGTYFPPVARDNMPAFKDILAVSARAWREQQKDAARIGDKVTDRIRQALNVAPQTRASFSQDHLNAAASQLLDDYDWSNGGWGSAPKFPQAMAIEFLLRCAAKNKETENPANSLTLRACFHALRAMARGGMYDVVGGGFSRYSTDVAWRTPHFEKMLYDNALLARAYLHAWQISNDSFFKRIAAETLDFIAREMTHPAGGFYSSLNAESEGQEGKFYVWTLEQIRATLQSDSELFEAAYGIAAHGNWEGKAILQRVLDDGALAARFKLDPQTLAAILTDCHSRLLSARSQRVRPSTDDKILTSWNGLALATLAEAARVFSAEAETNASIIPDNAYYIMATRNAEFLLSSLRTNGSLKHSWRDGKIAAASFLEDYAALILGLLELYQTDFNVKWYSAAQELVEEMIARFADPDGGFFDTPADGETLLLRPKDVQDNASPSGNALACEALLLFSEFSGEGKYRERAEAAFSLVVGMAAEYPTSFARWLSAANFSLEKVKQLAIVSAPSAPEALEFIRFARSVYRPAAILAASTFPPPPAAPALLQDRPLKNGKTTAYVCEGFVCKNPVTSLAELRGLLQPA